MRVGFVGLGSMGKGLCANLLRHGHVVQAFNRSPAPLAWAVSLGAQPCRSAADAAADADVVFVCLSSLAAQQDMTFGQAGIYAAMRPGVPYFDLGTWDLAAVRRFKEEAARFGVRYAAMPMGKGPEAAEAGETPLFYGGDADVFASFRPLLEQIGLPAFLGDAEQACAFKLITNLMGLTINVVLTEGVRLARALGIADETFLNGVPQTGAHSYQYANSGRKLAEGAFLPARGILDNALKDMSFGVELAQSEGVGCPFFSLARERYREASERGYGQEDYIAVYKLLKA